MGTSFKRLLFLGHRWLGIVLCAFFAMWFVSGVVMMYVGYPKLTEAERLGHLPPLQAGAPLLGPQQAMALAGIKGPLKELRLAAASGGNAVYLAQPAGSKGAAIAVDARSGARLAPTGEARAMASAAAFAGPGVGARYLGPVDEDAFTHSRGLDAHRPLHQVQLSDPARTLLYVSGRTGEVVRDAPRSERLWNYAGAWLHWLYPLRGNAFDPYWGDIVNWLALAGTVMVLGGMAVGLLRWRFRAPYRSGSRSPYPGALMRWHHIGGLLFGAVTATWIFSGLMSMNPWRIFDGGAPPLRMQALEGAAPLPSAGDAAPAALLAAAGPDIRELKWTRVLGGTLVLAQPATGKPLVLDSQTGHPAALDSGALLGAARTLLPHAVASVERLDAYDLYYYSRDAHSMTGGAGKPLPVWRIAFADPHQSWVYVDPHTGALAGRSDSHKRTSRWLFAMLHSWDWLPLLERRPLWDLVLLALSLGGAVLSVSGMVIGWRRLGRKLGTGGNGRAQAGRGQQLPSGAAPTKKMALKNQGE
ncbi:PepSY domain-containing protein [Massilia aquatica]|uniref:PepSY domain-containing protein n=1 Tax=Massilia aquatica TaxID=2609000 RepID=A0ABX0M4K9_9BURK|nr:PepSY domain-containing protein [Massilia aquatica]NHZ41543.1 PepSY domain-containing protein [Massilia aquatica]